MSMLVYIEHNSHFQIKKILKSIWQVLIEFISQELSRCSSLNIDDNEKINKMINEEDNETFWHGLPQMSKPIIIWCHIDAPRNVVSENPTIYSQAIQTSLL